MCVSITEKLEMGLCPVISSPLPLMMTMYRGSSDHSRKPGLMGSQVYPLPHRLRKPSGFLFQQNLFLTLRWHCIEEHWEVSQDLYSRHYIF